MQKLSARRWLLSSPPVSLSDKNDHRLKPPYCSVTMGLYQATTPLLQLLCVVLWSLFCSIIVAVPIKEWNNPLAVRGAFYLKDAGEEHTTTEPVPS